MKRTEIFAAVYFVVSHVEEKTGFIPVLYYAFELRTETRLSVKYPFVFCTIQFIIRCTSCTVLVLWVLFNWSVCGRCWFACLCSEQYVRCGWGVLALRPTNIDERKLNTLHCFPHFHFRMFHFLSSVIFRAENSLVFRWCIANGH